jgi:hypothetical protein
LPTRDRRTAQLEEIRVYKVARKGPESMPKLP